MSQTLNLRWEGAYFAEEADRAFRKTLIAVGIPFLVIALLLAFIKLELPKSHEAPYVPPATVELLPGEEPAEPAPQAAQEEEPAPAKENKPEPPKEAAPKKIEKPVTQPVTPVTPVDPNIKAREVAQKSGVLAFADQLSDLRNKGENVANQTVNSNVLASKGAAGAAGGASSGDGGAGALAAASAGSAGIGGTGTEGVSSQQSGQGLGKRRTTTVASPVGFGRDKTKGEGAGGGKRGGRSYDEIQQVFDRAQGAFYSMYLRALRENAMLAGKVIISLTIAPGGNVTEAHIVSSELGDPELEGKIISKVRSLNFGAKEVPEFTYPNYRIKFQPPN